MKIAKISIITVLALAVFLFAAFRIFWRLPLPSYSGTVDLPGLSAPVEVRFDEFAVPHISAENEHDLFFAQGYITARERMFEMDVTRLAGRGELSTLFGDVTLDKDRYLKTVGFYRMARAEYAILPGWVKDVIVAYTEGVNAYLSTAKHLPGEYAILGGKPEPWAPEDTVVAAILMGYSLETSVDADLSFYRIGEHIGQERLQYLLPLYPDFAPTISPEEATVRFRGNPGTHLAHFPSSSRPRSTDPFGNAAGGIVGSNWMIFGPTRTSTGAPIFAGSPDLAPEIPAIFYLAHLVGAGYNVIGGSVPGAPGIASLGFNGHIAWSAIASQVDCLDFFVEKVNPENPDQYLTENGWVDFVTVAETVKIKTSDGIKEEKLIVKISRHGPIISDVIHGRRITAPSCGRGATGAGRWRAS